jgi:flavin-dependent dehydrogenase
LEATRNAGVKVLEKVLVTGFAVEEDGVKITAKDAEGTLTFKAKLLIGADGTNSLIARLMQGYTPLKGNRIVGVRGYFEGVEGASGTADLHFLSEGFNGYCWLFPTSQNEANVGVGLFLEGIPKEIHPKELMNQLLQTNEGLKQRLKNAKSKGNFEAWPLNTYDPHLPLVGDHVLLVGEAARLVNPINGEGIQYALLSGKWAAQTVQVCLEKNDCSATALGAYSKRVDDELGYGFKISALIIQLIRNRNLNPLWLRAFEAMIERSKVDPQYANLAGGILAGIVLPSKGLEPNFLFSTLQQATVNEGQKIVDETLKNPTTLPANVIKITQTGIDIATKTAQNPLGFLEWGVETALKTLEILMTTPARILQQQQKKAKQQEKPKPSGTVIRI